MRRLSSTLTMALIVSTCWIVLGSAAIGISSGDQRSELGWAILAFVAMATLVQPFRFAGPVAALAGTLSFAAATGLELHATGLTAGAAAVGSVAVVTVVLCVTPLVLHLLMEEIERLQRQVRYQHDVIEELTIRDGSAGAFRPKYIESLLSEEIDRARRYHRSLTLSVVAADDWDEVLDSVGEVGARNLSMRIVDQLAQGTRTVDKIVQLGGGVFAIVLPETPLEGAELLAARLQSSASAEAGLTLRIGLAGFPRDAVSSEALLREAREALTFARMADLLVVDRTLLSSGV